jgi:hypothetical protein
MDLQIFQLTPAPFCDITINYKALYKIYKQIGRVQNKALLNKYGDYYAFKVIADGSLQVYRLQEL